MRPHREFVAGVRAAAPVLLGIVPFGLVAGGTAIGAGLSVLQAAAMSAVVFAGASQLAMIELLGRDSTLGIVVATALIINARMVMYSASLAPYFLSESGGWRGLIAYVLTDQGFALSVTRYDGGVESVAGRRWFYLGAAAPLWVAWQVCTVVGAVVGARVPSWLPLRFAVPLTFLALLVPSIEDAPRAVAAVVGGTVATVGVGLPFNLGLVAGALAGVAAGVVTATLRDTEVTVE